MKAAVTSESASAEQDSALETLIAAHQDSQVDKAIADPPTQDSAVLESTSDDVPKSMSKNALKKAAKAEKFAALKLERRAREKVAKKEKKRERAEKRAAGELDDDDDEEKKRQAKKRKVDFGGRVLIDLGFDELMNDKEIKSLCSQLAYTHSANRNASFPFSLVFTSLNGRTDRRLEGLGDASHKRWVNTSWTAEGYEQLWKDQISPTSALDPAGQGDDFVPHHISAAATGEDIAPATVQEELIGRSSNAPRRNAQNTFVYLTADTEDELTELKPDETYIIGGICDHNRYKNLCLNKAKESGIRTARLPIGRYLASLPTRKVLTVNQVFEILVKWVETKDWEEALYSVIPKRKFHQGGKGNSTQTNIDLGAMEDNDSEDDAEESATPMVVGY